MGAIAKNLPSLDYLRECFDYNADTGELRWRRRPRKHFDSDKAHNISNGISAGKVIASKTTKGYLRALIDGKFHYAHRIAYKMATGEDIPKGYQIDHINGNPSDNSIHNLRVVSSGENQRNMKRNKNNTSGVQGVSWMKKAKLWRARISIGGKEIHLGTSTNKDKAIFLRKEAEEKYGFHSNHGRVAEC